MHALYAGPCLAPGVAGAIILNRALQENTEGSSCDSAALEALDRTAQPSRTRQQLAGLHRPARRPIAAGAAGGSLQGSFPPPVPFLGSTSMGPRPRPARAQGDHGGAQGSRPVRSAQSGRRFPRPSGGQGARQ
ncbi:hypothetical protein XENORESO_004947 [Xenotaenia resolanae]|uniref:Uncharacterized protein n=1 Tax=Xenotaenia resolanae TaxID=208358 RepID=A0ABV0WPR9_9TELE